jgi:hypothetical protein
MRFLLCAAVALLAPSATLAATFDVSLDEKNGERILVVARSGGGAAAVAAGGEDLRVLRGEEAEKAVAALAKVDTPDLPAAAGAEGGDRTKLKKKIVIHKMEIDEDADVEDRELRIIRKTDDSRREEELLRDEERFLIEGQPAAEAIERRIIRMKGVDEARAIKFIDETEGLDAGERAEMKTAAGI